MLAEMLEVVYVTNKRQDRDAAITHLSRNQICGLLDEVLAFSCSQQPQSSRALCELYSK
jgi:hypothetical protein